MIAPGSGLRAVGTCPEPSGFTFVELLIAATMMSLLFVGLGAHLRGGLIVWRRATETTQTLQQQRVAMDRLERDLATAILYDPRPESYGSEIGALPAPEFGVDRLAWFTVAPASPARPARVHAVTYACAPVSGVPGLWRTARSLGEARAGSLPQPQRLLPDCETLSMRYAYLPAAASEPLEWKAEWQAPEHTLPRLVEVSIRFASGGSLTRIFAIPAGILKPAEAPPT